ncbi:MAG: hypothetical protein HY531_01145 [Chloroflexi bacterium]|nr:hypothetical protein [Chloroflexota bacterium]
MRWQMGWQRTRDVMALHRGIVVLVLIGVAILAVAGSGLLPGTTPVQAAHGTHTNNLHTADVLVGSTTYNTMTESAVAGTLDTASAVLPQNTEVVLQDAAGISIFASDAVPAGTVWDISGSWTFNPYIRTSTTSRGWVRARVYHISTSGTATEVLYSQNATRYDTTTAYQLMSWSGTVPAGTLLQAGERFGVAFFFYTDRSGNPTGYLGFDHSSAPSNTVANVRAGVTRQAHYRIGQDTALTAMTWYAAVDTGATNIPRNTNFRVRFQLYNNGVVNRTWTPQLEWSATPGSGYAIVPTTSGATPFFVTDTTQYTNGAAIATGNFGLGTGTGTAQAGVAYDTANPAGAAITLNTNSYTEIEFNIKANTNATEGGTYYFRLTTAGALLATYEAEAQITILIPGNVREAHYRIGQDSPLAAMTWYAAADTAATGIPQNTNFRVRFQLYNNGGTSVNWTPQLEWTATQGSGYAAVPTTSGAPPFFVADTAQFTNAAAIATGNFALGTGTGTAQVGVAYDTQNPAGAAITLNANSYTEVEFNIQANTNASPGASYYFRFTSGGSALTAYETADARVTIQALTGILRQAHYRIGQDSPLTTMTWYAATDVLATGIPQSTNLRVRFQVYNNGSAGINWAPQLEWTATQGSGYAAVPTTSGAPPFFVADTAQFTNATAIATANFGLGTGTGTAQAGVAYDTQNPAGAAITLNANSYTEIEFNIQANANATLGTTYYFRLTNSGAALDGYDVTDAQLRIQTPGVVREARYRIGQDNSLTAMTWYAAADTGATNIPRNTNFRVRFQVYNNGELAASWLPQLEWTATAGSGYATVPVTSGAVPFFVSHTTYFANGDAIATANFGLGVGTGTPQEGAAYEDQNPPATALNLSSGFYTEVEFNVQANSNATLGLTYYFRFSNGGTALASYATADAQITLQSPCSLCSDHYRVGKDDPLTAMTWYAAVDTPVTALPKNTNFRVRFQLSNNGDTNTTWTPRLEWSSTSGSGYAAVPITSGAAPFFVVDTAQFANGATIATASFYLGSGTGTAQAGIAYDTQNPAGASIILNAASYAEVEFSVQANNNASDGASYFFRLTDNGTALVAYQHPAAEVVAQTAPPPTPTPGPPAHNFFQPYNATTSACAACHRTHTAVSPTTLYKQWPQEQVCFTCHDGTGAPNIMAQFAKTYKMPMSTTSSLHSLVEWRTKSPSSFSGANRHVSCVDCHNPHYAAAGNHTIGSNYAFGPQLGVWGIAPSYTAAWTTPSFATVPRITYQYELCFKCHSSWAFGTNPPTVPSGGFPETDIAKEFNPLNPSYMPVMAVGKNPFRLASGTSYASSLINGFTPTSRMVCSDCHGSETTSDPQGPHGSNNPFLLKGLWNRTTGQSGTSTHLCFKCHDSNAYLRGGSGSANSTGFSGGGKNLHTLMVGGANKAYNNNPIVCMDCHVAIPHGYYRDHLIGYSGDGSPYINRPYVGGLTTINTWQNSGQWTFNSCSTAMGNCK